MFHPQTDRISLLSQATICQERQMLQLKVLVNSVLKQQPIDSSKLPADQKQSIAAETVLEISSFTVVADHLKVTFADRSFQGQKTWMIFQRHAVILKDGKVNFPQATRLAVPYLDQLDNSDNPYGTCNVTSLAMVLSYFRVPPRNPSIRFPDELDRYCTEKNLDRHEPATIAQVAEDYGCHDRFTQTASFEQVKEWLAQGNPAIVHGYFTPSGHIICIIGYNEKGFIVNDPYGELMFDPNPELSHYDIYTTGAGLTYSYNLIYQTCCTDHQFWVHFISKR
ncbi:C39 family peptidase [Leptolyngbya boryana CZ1]|nr:C39 family peptidase [Leptolyngbya boryana]WNZ47532.1 C39 family peptidase [Leptolyngbya boryana CZ1]